MLWKLRWFLHITAHLPRCKRRSQIYHLFGRRQGWGLCTILNLTFITLCCIAYRMSTNSWAMEIAFPYLMLKRTLLLHLAVKKLKSTLSKFQFTWKKLEAEHFLSLLMLKWSLPLHLAVKKILSQIQLLFVQLLIDTRRQ